MRLAVTMGDPAGIGPEILVKAWRQMRGNRVVYGDVEALAAAAERWAPDWRVSLDGPKISRIGCGSNTLPPSVGPWVK